MKTFLSSIFFFLISIFIYQPAQADITIPTGTGLPDPSGGIMAILMNFTSWLLTVFLVLTLLAFVITGVMYLLAMGDSRSQNLENAKQYFQSAIKALVIVGGSYIIIRFIDFFLLAIL